ncbi:caltractin [Iris pallida]|uniref:Caltractin n=1 Tax=Iris pallida TaxID=29817 RepID=A0AAX6DUU1_IRIPA|nr:caltractin [Iris pallida]
MCPTGRHSLLPAAASSSSAAAAISPDLLPAFNVLDADRDGKIGRDDLKSFYSSRSGPDSLSDDAIGAMISAADSDRDGFVQFEEFESVLGRRQPTGGSIMEEVFRVIDRDGDGRVGFADLKSYLELAGMGAGDDDVRAMIRMGGGDEEQGIGLESFVRILTVGFAN